MDKYIIEMMSDTNGIHRLDELGTGNNGKVATCFKTSITN